MLQKILSFSEDLYLFTFWNGSAWRWRRLWRRWPWSGLGWRVRGRSAPCCGSGSYQIPILLWPDLYSRWDLGVINYNIFTKYFTLKFWLSLRHWQYFKFNCLKKYIFLVGLQMVSWILGSGSIKKKFGSGSILRYMHRQPWHIFIKVLSKLKDLLPHINCPSHYFYELSGCTFSGFTKQN